MTRCGRIAGCVRTRGQRPPAAPVARTEWSVMRTARVRPAQCVATPQRVGVKSFGAVRYLGEVALGARGARYGAGRHASWVPNILASQEAIAVSLQ